MNIRKLLSLLTAFVLVTALLVSSPVSAATKPAIEFYAYFYGDGTATQLQLSLLIDPVLLKSGGQVFPIFASNLTAFPTGIADVTAANPISSVSYSTLTKTITINFSTPPAAQLSSVSGFLQF